MQKVNHIPAVSTPLSSMLLEPCSILDYECHCTAAGSLRKRTYTELFSSKHLETRTRFFTSLSLPLLWNLWTFVNHSSTPGLPLKRKHVHCPGPDFKPSNKNKEPGPGHRYSRRAPERTVHIAPTPPPPPFRRPVAVQWQRRPAS